MLWGLFLVEYFCSLKKGALMAEYIKLPELARRLNVSEKTARRMVRAGRLPSVFVGGAYRVTEEDLERFLEQAKVEPGKAEAPPSPEPSFNDVLFEEEERRIVNGIIGPWISWLENDAELLERIVVTAEVHEKLAADRRNIVEALDKVGDALQSLGIDWGDSRNRAMRRAHDDLFKAFGGWHRASIDASAAYLDSRARAQEEERFGRTHEKLREVA
jgi:excisionase family DNA binding protein